MDTATHIVQWHQRIWQCGRTLAQVRRDLARQPDDPVLRAVESRAIEAVRDARRQIERARMSRAAGSMPRLAPRPH